MIWFSAIITFLALGGAMSIWWFDWNGLLESSFGTEGATDLRDMAETAYLILLAPLAIYIYRFYMAAQARSNAILVGPAQFPELYALYQDLAQRLDMPNPPKLYVTNGDGVVNAYALECNRRYRYIVMHSEITLMLAKSPDVVEFVLAHEMAHHKLRHVSLWRIIIGMVPNMLVLPGQTTTRAQEYSADRVAMAVCPNHASAIRILAVGPWIADGVNPDAWLEQCDAEHREWMVRAANAVSSHAVGVKRFKALRDIERKGFSAHGEMF
ncbi:M48 family metallopeptidase [Paracoccus amoyensis]|nr:M48 family metallopeptidase [Paracoccus amoyensis]